MTSMCGAFAIRLNPYNLPFLLDIRARRSWNPIYNARPGEWLPIVTQDTPEQVTQALWHFVPHWAKGPKTKGVINARAETVDEKPYFRSAFRSSRCVIPADGFYEWLKSGKERHPFFFHRKDNGLFAFAGLYSALAGGDRIGFTLITTTPNELVAKVHNRMPVMLEEAEVRTWLSSSATRDELAAMLDPYPAEKMAVEAVSWKVNHAREKGADVLDVAA